MKTIKILTFLANLFLLLFLLQTAVVEGLSVFGEGWLEILISILVFVMFISNTYIAWESFSKKSK